MGIFSNISNNEINKLSCSIGSAIMLFNDIEYSINRDNIAEYKTHLFKIAYICKIGILDRIERNSWPLNFKIIILPTEYFGFKRIPLATALALSVGKLNQIAEYDYNIAQNINDILSGEGPFYNLLDKMITDEQRKNM